MELLIKLKVLFTTLKIFYFILFSSHMEHYTNVKLALDLHNSWRFAF